MNWSKRAHQKGVPFSCAHFLCAKAPQEKSGPGKPDPRRGAEVCWIFFFYFEDGPLVPLGEAAGCQGVPLGGAIQTAVIGNFSPRRFVCALGIRHLGNVSNLERPPARVTIRYTSAYTFPARREREATLNRAGAAAHSLLWMIEKTNVLDATKS